MERFMDIEATVRQLQKVLPENQISVFVPMKEHTTFRTGGIADLMIMPSSPEQVVLSLRILRDLGIPYIIIGRGSNLLVRDGGIRGAVVKLSDNFAGLKVQKNRIYAQAGASLGALVRTAHDHALCGMEFASGIPGSVGGAVAMNAGAYGGEIKDYTVLVKVLDKDLNEKALSAAELGFGYRKSIIAHAQFTVLEAEFSLEKGDVPEAKAKMREFNRQRREKQPLEYPSAGSTFKRPPGYFAGALIDQAGLRGFQNGGAQVSDKHAGFIINTGGASSADIIALIEAVRQKVLEKSGVLLETEVKIIGEEL